MKKELVILSGFLGTGKTTILKYLLQTSKELKLKVLLNDFGDIPVDGSLIADAKEAIEVLEIGGGSVFCSCLKEQFIKALFTLSTSDAQRIIVEASGMSDPSGVVRTLELAKLDNAYENPLIICLFDPQKSMKLSHVLEVIPRQVKAASIVVLTKSDVSTEQERENAREYIQSLSPQTPIIESFKGILDLENLPTSFMSDTPLNLFSFNTPETRLDTFTFTKEVNNLDAFLEILKEYDALLRVKGCIKYKDTILFVEDTPNGIEARSLDIPFVPLTLICMPTKAQALQEKLENTKL